MNARTLRTIYGALLTAAGAALAFAGLWRGGLTWPVLIAMCVLLALGGHLVSHSQMRELVEDAATLLRAWRGGGGA